jgi:hypothetical protein
VRRHRGQNGEDDSDSCRDRGQSLHGAPLSKRKRIEITITSTRRSVSMNP